MVQRQVTLSLVSGRAGFSKRLLPPSTGTGVRPQSPEEADVYTPPSTKRGFGFCGLTFFRYGVDYCRAIAREGLSWWRLLTPSRPGWHRPTSPNTASAPSNK